MTLRTLVLFIVVALTNIAFAENFSFRHSISEFNESNRLVGFYAISSTEIVKFGDNKYIISKFDSKLNEVKSIVEYRKHYEVGIADLTLNGKDLCILYSNDIAVYSTQTLTEKFRVKPKLEKGFTFAKITVNANNNYIVTAEHNHSSKVIFLCFDKNLNLLWEYLDVLDSKEKNVKYHTAELESKKYVVTTATNIYGFNNVLVNNSKNGNLVMKNSLDLNENLFFTQNPEYFLEDAKDELFEVGDYCAFKGKDRGLFLSKMDLKNKNSANKYIKYKDPEIFNKLTPEMKTIVEKNSFGLLPYGIVKHGKGFLIFGDVYNKVSSLSVNTAYGYLGGWKSTHLENNGTSLNLFVMELSADFKVEKISFMPTKNHFPDDMRKEHAKRFLFHGNITGYKYDSENRKLSIDFIDESPDDFNVGFMKIEYTSESGLKEKTAKIVTKQKGIEEDINIFENTSGKLTVVRTYRSTINVTEE